MNASSFDRVTAALEGAGRLVRYRGEQQAVAQCPAHDDHDPSLSIRHMGQQVNLHCFVGCDNNDVVDALGLTMADLFDDPKGPRYEYRDQLDGIVKSVRRTPDKQFIQSGKTKVSILYRLPQVIEAVKAGRTIYLVEGEKDVEALETIGAVATTAPMGASNVGKVDMAPLHGATVVAIVDKDAAGQKWASKVHDALDGKARSLTFKQAAVGKDAADHLTADRALDELEDLKLDDPDTEPMPRLWRATDLAGIKQPEWLAKDRLPKSAVTILVGDEGIGKSLLWVWIIAAVTTGKPLTEFGIPARVPGVVVLVLTEDEWSYTVRPRLEVAGADLDMIRVICTDVDGAGAPVFPRDMHLLTSMDEPPALVVVDAFLDTVPGNLQLRDPQQARRALHPWKETATITKAAIMLLTHTNRVDSKNARDKYGITSELRKKARMTLFAQQDDDGNMVVGPDKSNITGSVPASKFTIQPVQKFEPTLDHDGTVPLLTYIGESNMTARDYIEANYATQHGEDADERDEAATWLREYLIDQGGSAPAGDVIKKAQAVGLAKTTLTRARKRAGVTTGKSGMAGGWVWTLEESTPPEESTEGTEGTASRDMDSSVPSVVPSVDVGHCTECHHTLTNNSSVTPGLCIRCADERKAS